MKNVWGEPKRGRGIARIRCARRALLCEALEDRLAPAIALQFDYSYDPNGFFASQWRRDLLQMAGDTVAARLSDSLLSLEPSGSNTWQARFWDPSTGFLATVNNPTIAANTLVIYAGGRPLDGYALAEGGFGGTSASGTLSWRNRVAARGQTGALANPETDFGPWGGSIAFDTDGTDWYFGTTISGINGGQADFYSVAVHELGHVLGVGTADSWFRYVSSDTFTGPNAVARYGSAVPLQTGGAHWLDGITDGGLETAMDPTIFLGTRKAYTGLDYAGLRDIGWVVGANSPPVAYAGTGYVIAEGSALALAAESYDPDGNSLSYTWDVNGDGVYGDATGIAPVLTWSQLVGLGISDGNTSRQVRVRANDGAGGVTTSPATTLQVNNAAPVASIDGPTTAVRGAPLTFTLTATDPSAVDQAAGFTFQIDWNGDGATDQTVVGASGVQVGKIFDATGTYYVRVTATDKDGGVSPLVTRGVNVVPWTLTPQSGNLSLVDLVIGGTTAADFYTFWGLGGRDIGVIANDLGIFRADGVTGKIIVYMQDGDDGITINQAVNGFAFQLDMGDGLNVVAPVFGSSNSITYFGGAGVDQFFQVAGPNNAVTMHGGGGDDVYLDVSEDHTNTVSFNGGEGNDGAAAGLGLAYLDGGNGNDMLVSFGGAATMVGGAGDDFLVGGPGAAHMNGGAGSDLIVAGSLVFLPVITDGYLPIWAEWGLSGHSFATRVNNIAAGNLGGLNDPYNIVNGSTALDNGVVDTILGGDDADWLIYEFTQDIASDYSPVVDVRTDLG